VIASAYYNEHDSFAAAWLRELIAAGLICPGDVDERSIEDVRPGDLAGYTQCHFFAGIGIWSLALRQAGWPDDRPVWTGSCPCPPFSSAGKQFRCPVCNTPSPVPNAVRTGAFNCVGCDHEWQADSRHLFPEFFRLTRDCRPATVFGEQVSSADGITWIDVVRASLEMVGYAVGHADTPAAGFGAPHIRQRLYFGAKRLADARGEDQGGRRILGPGQGDGASARTARERSAGLRTDGGLADADGGNASAEGLQRGGQQRQQPQDSSALLRLADADDTRSQGRIERRDSAGERIAWPGSLEREEPGRPGPVNGLWRNADWLFCRDGKWRPVESSPLALADDGSVCDLLAGGGRASDALTFPLAETGTFKNRVAELRGAGNALNLAQASGFISTFMEAVDAA